MISKYDFDTVIDRRGTDCNKYDMAEAVFGRGDILPMWIADMDFCSPPEVVEAVRECADAGVFGYTYRTEEAKQVFVDWVDALHGWKIEKRWTLSSPGVVIALSLGVRLLTQPGDKVLVFTPVYPPFFDVIKRNGRELAASPLTPAADGCKIDWEDFEAKLKSGVKLLIFCNPHNPVGRQWTRAELERVGELCLEYGVKIISDEIHSDLSLFGHRHTVMASVSPEIAAITVTATAPSKTFNVAGMADSVVVVQDETIRRMFARELNVLHLAGGNIFGHVAFKAAYRYGRPWRDALLRYVEGNVNMAADYFANELPEVGMRKPECSYLLWLDFRATGLSHEEVGERLVNKGLIGLNDGADFGPDGVGFRRMNIGCPASVVADGLERIKRSLR